MRNQELPPFAEAAKSGAPGTATATTKATAIEADPSLRFGMTTFFSTECAGESLLLARPQKQKRQSACGGLAHAAGGEDLFAGEPAGVVGSEEHGDGADIVGLSRAAEGRLGDETLLEIRADEARGGGAFGFYDSGVDGIDANFLGAEFPGKHAGDGVDGAFSGGIDRRIRRSDAADAGADVDDAGAFAEMLGGGLGGE